MTEKIISISIPPFPDFIEGNFRQFRVGQNHPDRKNLGYFDLVAVKKGCLYLAEDEERYTIKENELFIMLPNGHHRSWQPVDEATEFYWVHFYVSSQWVQGNKVRQFVSDLPIPDLHYHQQSYTLNLRKHAQIKEPRLFFDLFKKMLDSTVSETMDSYDIWETEELFLRFLRFIEDQGIHKDRKTLIAEEIYGYLKANLTEKITNESLEKQFHLHRNHLANITKYVYGKTPQELLFEIRIEGSKQLLLRSDMAIKEISDRLGFSSEIYFSNRFRKAVGLSPQQFRKKY